MLLKHGGSHCASFVDTMMIARSSMITFSSCNRSPGKSPGEKHGSRSLDAIARLLVGKPGHELGHPVLDCRRGPELQERLRSGGVSVAVADVAGSVLGRDLRLDADAETL